jgi:hypothetical protein
MAFSELERAKIRRYLGYPDVFRFANTRLESAMDVVGERQVVADLVRQDLADLDRIDAKLSSVAISQGGLKRIDVIEFYEGAVVNEIRNSADRFRSRLSVTFGVPIASDVFGPDGYTGDNWSRSATQVGMFALG